MRIGDWSSDGCSSELSPAPRRAAATAPFVVAPEDDRGGAPRPMPAMPLAAAAEAGEHRQEEEEKDDEADEEKPADIAVVGAVARFGSRRLEARGRLLGDRKSKSLNSSN